MNNLSFLKKMLIKKLLKLIKRHGMSLTIQALIEIARADKDNKKMQELALDLEKALSKYKKESLNDIEKSDKNYKGTTLTKENYFIGAKVKCICYYKDRFGKTATISDLKYSLNDFNVEWDDGCNDYTQWYYYHSFILLE